MSGGYHGAGVPRGVLSLRGLEPWYDTRTQAGARRDPKTPLFKTRPRQHISSGDLFSYDVAADGQRFLVNTDVGEAGATSLYLIQSWPMMVRR